MLDDSRNEKFYFDGLSVTRDQLLCPQCYEDPVIISCVTKWNCQCSHRPVLDPELWPRSRAAKEAGLKKTRHHSFCSESTAAGTAVCAFFLARPSFPLNFPLNHHPSGWPELLQLLSHDNPPTDTENLACQRPYTVIDSKLLSRSFRQLNPVLTSCSTVSAVSTDAKTDA